MVDVSNLSPEHQAIWDIICEAARGDERCPGNEDFRLALIERGLHPRVIPRLIEDLARTAFVRSEVCGKNWRTVHVLVGPLAGKSTKVHPLGYAAYLVTDHLGVHRVTDNRLPLRF